MAGKRDSAEREANAARYLQINQRKGDRDPQFAVHDIVQVRVLRVVIVLAIPTVPFLLDEHGIECSQNREGFAGGGEPAAHPRR